MLYFLDLFLFVFKEFVFFLAMFVCQLPATA